MKKLVPRKFERVSHVRDVTYRIGGGGSSRRGNTVDLSQKGVRLFTRQSIPIGESVELTWVGRQPPLTLGGHVVQSKVDTEGCLIGVVFHQALTPEVFDALRKN